MLPSRQRLQTLFRFKVVVKMWCVCFGLLLSLLLLRLLLFLSSFLLFSFLPSFPLFFLLYACIRIQLFLVINVSLIRLLCCGYFSIGSIPSHIEDQHKPTTAVSSLYSSTFFSRKPRAERDSKTIGIRWKESL